MSALQHRLSLGLVAGLTALTYARVGAYGWVYDDAAWLPGDVAGGARFPFALAGWLGGGLPGACHLLILWLHLVNGVLLWIVLRRWLSETACLLAVTLFWLHPIQVEAVAYVSGGLEVLLTSYVLVAWVAIRSAWWPLAFASLAAAVSLKYSALPLAIVLPVAWAIEARSSRRWCAAVALTALPVAGFFARSAWEGYAHLGGWALRLENLRLLSLALCRYLALVVVPVGFSIVHDWRLVPMALGWLALAALMAVAVSAYRASWSAPWLAVCWIAALIVPRALTLPSAPPLTEHHTMLPFLALWALVGSTYDRCSLLPVSVPCA